MSGFGADPTATPSTVTVAESGSGCKLKLFFVIVYAPVLGSLFTSGTVKSCIVQTTIIPAPATCAVGAIIVPPSHRAFNFSANFSAA